MATGQLLVLAVLVAVQTATANGRLVQALAAAVQKPCLAKAVGAALAWCCSATHDKEEAICDMQLLRTVPW